MTKGEYRVGIDFNPSASDTVNQIKRKAADLIDLIAHVQEARVHTAGDFGVTDDQQTSEVIELTDRAMREVESAAMWAVKAATKGSPH